MYIKYGGISNNDITIINANISSSIDITTEGNLLIITMEKEEDTIKLKLKDEDSAKLAQEKLFLTLGLKAPQNNILDLTNLDVIESNELVGITMQEIADKFKIDVRELTIVAIPKMVKTSVDDVQIEGGEI